mmetsp:Transcript_97984/g.193940  ORF Transcript_97984/g.193940 Transcript_97984/m.193940 type:complete len:179 (-) Transcript_97984:66-602(-)
MPLTHERPTRQPSAEYGKSSQRTPSYTYRRMLPPNVGPTAQWQPPCGEQWTAHPCQGRNSATDQVTPCHLLQQRCLQHNARYRQSRAPRKPQAAHASSASKRSGQQHKRSNGTEGGVVTGAPAAVRCERYHQDKRLPPLLQLPLRGDPHVLQLPILISACSLIFIDAAMAAARYQQEK